ncbi:MAG: hypothetical protein GX660_01955 [Clostridiaceae bacterium]|nr:hypothetical protein [Clostridiaceae bacterium]
MKPVEQYKIKDDTGFHYKSLICSLAGSVGFKSQFSDLDYRIKELTQSFFNQWRFIIETYQRLYFLFSSLNKCSDNSGSISRLSEFDMYASKHELDFKDFSYLLIVSLKTYLDLFACIIDIIINQKIRPEHSLPDFKSFGRKSKRIPIEISNAFKDYMDENKYPWISQVIEIRNMIIHRGYHLKLKIGFKKTDSLIIQAYKGTDFYTNQVLINIGDIFNSFLLQMPKIEEKISNLLIEKVELLNKTLDYEMSYSFGDLINNYVYKELKPGS